MHPNTYHLQLRTLRVSGFSLAQSTSLRECPWVGPINAALKHLKLATVIPGATLTLSASSASLFLCRCLDAFLSSFTHAGINLQPPSRIVLYQAPGSSAAVFQSSVMPNSRRSSTTQSVHYFSFPPRPCFPAFSNSPDMTLLGNLWSPIRSSAPTTATSPCAWLFRCSRIRFAGRRLCRRGYAYSATCTRVLGFEATLCRVLYGAWFSGPSKGSMSCIRTREPLLPRPSPSGPSEAADLPSGGHKVPAFSA